MALFSLNKPTHPTRNEGSDMLKFLSVVTFALALWPSQSYAQPNILLIIADDVGLDAVPCYDAKNQAGPMPNLAKMCTEGLVFENGYAAPVCSPTRATIMTGQYGFRTGVGAAIAPRGSNGLSSNVTSLFDVLSSTNYSTNIIGKWHLAGADSDLNHPAELGIPDYFGLIRGATRDYFNWTAVHKGEEQQIDGYTTTVFTDRAIEWIDAQDKDQPWFLWLAHNAPHAPFHLPPEGLHSFNDLADDADAAAQNPLPYYQAMLEALDTEIGRLLASMSDEERDNTIVIFIGDNGSPNQVTRGFYGDHAAKGTIFDSGTHVPFVVSGPGVKKGRTNSLVQSSDLFATIASLAGASTENPDSYDFSSVLSGGSTKRDYIYVEHFSDEAPRRSEVFGWAIRDAQYKLIAPEGGDKMLFDLSADPLEANNLLLENANEDIVAAAAALEAKFATLGNN